MSSTAPSAMQELLERSPVLPVVTIEEAAIAPLLARALVRGGIRIMEVTLRTPAALAAIEAIAREVPEMALGAGTVLSSADLHAAAEAGASFAVSPGATPVLLAAAAASPMPYLPAVATASELMLAMQAGYRSFKLFPASAAGGPALLAALAGPFPQARFCPTGGISPENAGSYLALPNVSCVGGSWLTPPALIARRDWDRLETLAAQASALRP
jgi:2-dehydro-3-deoxyphosphogluconate aldolase / (4S)-4-hydroxy-2-oxoglutarate aldolase